MSTPRVTLRDEVLANEGDSVVLRVHLFRTEDGGRGQKTPAEKFGCPVEIRGELFDCRMSVGRDGIAPGETAAVAVRFLLPNLVLRMLRVGDELRLWEGRWIGTATVLRLPTC